MEFDYTSKYKNTECWYVVLNELAKKYIVYKDSELLSLTSKLAILQEYLIQDLGVRYVSYDENGYNFKIVDSKKFVLTRLKYEI